MSMTFTDVLRKIVIPVMTLASALGSAYVTYLLAGVGRFDGAACTALLTGGIGYFVYRDAKMLFAK